MVADGKLVKQDTVQEFERHPNSTFKHLMRYAEMLRGEKAQCRIIR